MLSCALVFSRIPLKQLSPLFKRNSHCLSDLCGDSFTPTAQIMYVDHTPRAPSSSSTSFPNMYSMNMFEERCCQSLWQNADVRNCHHRWH